MLPKVDDASLSLRGAYPEAEKDLSAARARLTKAGLGCHKEVIGLPNALGYEVVQKQRFLPNVSGKRVSSQGLFSDHESLYAKGKRRQAFPDNCLLHFHPSAKLREPPAPCTNVRGVDLVSSYQQATALHI